STSPRTSPSRASAAAASTTTRAAATRRATSSRRRSPSSKAARARSSRRAGSRRSRSCSISRAAARASSRRTTATAAPGGSRALADKGWLEVELADLTDPAARDEALARSPSLVWIETPSNPLLRITDLAATCAAAKRAGALVAVDNTFLSPLLQRPLESGADLVVHSTTKYLNGHSDVVGGAVVAATKELHEKLTWWANCLGLTGAPFDSFLTLRGVRTLAARMRAHEENAARVAHFLVRQPAVARVYWPGLESHEGHALARRQQAGFGAMISFELAGDGDDSNAAVERFLERLELFSLAESLGGVESLIAHPATMTHAAMEPAARARPGISDRLPRLRVGIEDAEDLVADLAQALAGVAAPSTSPAPHALVATPGAPCCR